MKETFFPNKIIQIIGLLIVPYLCGTPVIIFVAPKSFLNNYFVPTIFYVIYCLSFIGLVYLINSIRKQKVDLNFKIVNIRFLYLLLILILVFNIGILQTINNILGNVFHHNSVLANPFNKPLYTIGAILIGPILEEIIFRGIILKGLLTRYNPKYAILISSFLFALIHIKPLQMWGAFMLGLIFGWIYYKTKSTGTTVLLHSFNNAICTIVSYLTYRNHNMENLYSINILLIILSIPIIFILIRTLIYKSVRLDSMSKKTG